MANALLDGLLDGLLAEVAALVSTLFDARSGLLTQELDVPVLSWLYQELFGEPLTLVNAIALVVAIPVTVLWRIVEGEWPSASVGRAGATRRGLGDLPPVIARILGFAGPFVTIALGFVAAFGDALGDGDVPLWVGRAALAAGMLTAAIGLPPASSSAPSGLDWAVWGIGLGATALNLLGSLSFEKATADVLTPVIPTLLSMLSICQVAALGIQFGTEFPPDPWQDAALGIAMFATLPGILNPIKLGGEVLALVVAALDIVMGFAVGAIQMLTS